MAFDFPNSPTTGQIYQPTGGPLWQYDGEKWKGGQLAGPQKETWIDYAGKSTVDVAVPTWAKIAHITASIQPTTGGFGQLQMRISGDGTTFYAGATDYLFNGPLNTVVPPAFSTTPGTSQSYFLLAGAHDNPTVPCITTVEVPLARASDANFTYKAHSVSYHSTTAHLTTWYSGYIAAGTLNAAHLTIKALRIYGLTGKAGSYIHIKWLGDDAQMPISNAIPDCPSDGNEYVRVNGVWRLSKQTFFPGAQLDIQVPTGARTMALTATLWWPSTNLAFMRWSADGTTFPLTTADYTYAGWAHLSQSGLSNAVATNNFYVPLTGTLDNATIPASLRVVMPVVKTIGTWGAEISSRGYHSVNGIVHVSYHAWTNNAALTAATQLKAIRISATTVAFSAGSNIVAEWLY